MNQRFLSMAVASLGLFSALAAGCDDETTSSGGAGGSGGSGGDGATTATGGTGADGGAGGMGGTAGAGGSAGGDATLEVVAAFDPTLGQFVEGLDIRSGVAYVGALPTGQIFTVDLANPVITPFGGTPAFTQNQGALVGLTVGSDGAVYAALNVTDPAGPPTGIYRIDPAGGTGVLFASDPSMAFCNDVRFDDGGDLLVSDSFSGAIFKIDGVDGTVTTWVADPLLAPDPSVCGVETAFHLGVNGFIRKDDAYYAVNTDRASVVKIPVNPDGTAGTPEVFIASDCDALSGADGVVVDPVTGDLLVAVNYQNEIVRVGMDQSVTTVVAGDPLQSPATLALDGSDLYVTSAAFEALATDPANAKPSLAKLPLE